MKLDPSQLRTSCKPAEFAKPMDNLRLAQNLFQTMIRERGIGLAANQVGIDVRLFVMMVDREAFHCFNPEIVEASTEFAAMTEGCLSFPDQRCDILRPKTILARYANSRGQYETREFTGLAARCFQHELDHLNGIVMHDRIRDHVRS